MEAWATLLSLLFASAYSQPLHAPSGFCWWVDGKPAVQRGRQSAVLKIFWFFSSTNFCEFKWSHDYHFRQAIIATFHCILAQYFFPRVYEVVIMVMPPPHTILLKEVPDLVDIYLHAHLITKMFQMHNKEFAICSIVPRWINWFCCGENREWFRGVYPKCPNVILFSGLGEIGRAFCTTLPMFQVGKGRQRRQAGAGIRSVPRCSQTPSNGFRKKMPSHKITFY